MTDKFLGMPKILLSVKHLPVWLMVSFMRLLALLPLPEKLLLGKGVGLLSAKLIKSRYAVTHKNIQACFPELSASEQHALTEQAFIANAQGGFETVHSWWADIAPVLANLDVVGLEHVQEAEALGKGVFLIGGHYSMFDLALPLIASQLSQPGYMYRPNDNPVLDYIIESGRRRHADGKLQCFTKRQLKQMTTFIQQGGAVWYACDQDFGAKSDVFSTFFGMPVACISAPSYVAQQSGASVIYVRQHRLATGRYQIEFSPIQKNFGEDKQQDADSWNAWLEQSIRLHPEQYLWLHKRFKTRPEGMGSFY